MSLRIEHNGYVVHQAENNHITISKNGKRVGHASCTIKHTEESLRDYADSFLLLADKLLSREHAPTSPIAVFGSKTARFFPSQEETEQLRQKYPIGTRLYLTQMDDPYAPVPSGTRGSVEYIDDAGQIHMEWDNGRTLALVPGVDSFRKLTAGEEQWEVELEDFCRDIFSNLLALPGDYDTFHISDKDEFLTVRLDKSPDGKLSFHVSFTPEGGHTANQEAHTVEAEYNADSLLHACRKVLLLYGK